MSDFEVLSLFIAILTIIVFLVIALIDAKKWPHSTKCLRSHFCD